MNINHLKDHFLIATPRLNQSDFAHTLLYISDHDAQGAIGVIINQPTDFSIADLLLQKGIATDPSHPYANQYLHAGGPTYAKHCFVLHYGEQQPTSPHAITTNAPIHLSAATEALIDTEHQHGFRQALIFTGCAGWAPKQLEKEIIDNAWVVCPAQKTIIFDTPPQRRLDAALEYSGISLENFSNEQGHS